MAIIKYPYDKQKTIDFADNEFYLSFDDDQHAMIFQWWVEENWDKFLEYYKDRKDD